LECLEQKHWVIKPAIRWYSQDPFSFDFTKEFVRQSQSSKYEQEIEDWQDLSNVNNKPMRRRTGFPGSVG
jgi:hypothetical protein